MRFLARVLLLALLAQLLVVPPARAEDVVTISGGGWGHGIGMSQYGAYGRAKRGKNAPQILEHYYSSARVSKRKMPRRIRVGLLQSRNSISARSDAFTSGGGKVVFKVAGSSGRIATGGTEAQWRVEPSPTGGMRLYKDGRQVKENGTGVFGSPERPLVLRYQSFDSRVLIAEKGNRAYAYGRMEFGTYPSNSCDAFCLRLVVVLSMQKYLYGLAEVPASWPQSVLRAQAIAGRTYAYDKVLRSGQHREPCDCAVFDSTFDQAYAGDAKRTDSGSYWDDWKSAVDNTNRKVILHQGSPIQALYSSSSGGHTEHNENVWGGTPLPYLRGVRDKPDNNDANPNHKWSFEMTYRAFESKLNAAYGIGELKDFQLVRPFGVSGRVTVVKSPDQGGARIVGTKKTARESGWSLRSALSLKDTLFRVEITYGVGERFVSKYRRLDGAPGAPTSKPYAVPRGWKRPRGRAQNFKKGRMTWTKATGKVTWQRGRVLRKYNRLGREKSPLGMPTSDTWGTGSYQGAHYQRGMITWSKQVGAHSIRASFKRVYLRKGGIQGPLGLAKTERHRQKSLPRGGLRQLFTNGAIYRNPDKGEVFALWGAIASRYRKLGEARSKCGYPTASMSANESGAKADFQNGTITSDGSGSIEVNC